MSKLFILLLALLCQSVNYGFISSITIAPNSNTTKVGDSATSSGRSIKDQASDLVPANSNKNRVTLRSEREQLEIDLAGKDHAGVPTPHTKVSPRNHNAPDHAQPAYNTSEKKSTLRPSTQEDIRNARKYLERQNR